MTSPDRDFRVSKKPLMPILPLPFKVSFIIKELEKTGKVKIKKKKGSREAVYQEIAEKIRHGNSPKAYYLLVMIEIGVRLEEALQSLEDTRQINFDPVLEVMTISHSSDTRRGGRSYKQITDDRYLHYHAILTDALLLLDSHVKNFQATYLASKLPDYIEA